ncbi:MAG: tetratricopeptide repeat protein, partial [Elusimicrobia bacterium]|nr:tetratricopeptide repeat protein [Elusimicrobiota bacterium]
EEAFYLGYGRRWLNFGGGELYGGLNLKYLRSSFGSFPEAGNAVPSGGVVGGGQSDPLLSGRRSQSALDSDVGLLYRLGKHYGIGLDVMHANSPNVAYSGAEKDRLSPIVKLGFNYRSLLSNLAVEYDTQRAPAGTRDHSFTTAAERWFPKVFLGDFGLRGALSAGTRDYKQLSAGVSYRTRRLGADYAMSMPIGGPATTVAAHRVGLSFRFGRATEDEESLEMVLEAMKQFKSGQRVELRRKDAGASDALQRTLEELQSQARAQESHAKYAAALETLGRALTLAPADKTLVERYGRLSFISQQIREVPEYRTDPMQASLHLGIVSYLAGDGAKAVLKVSEAVALAPERKDLEGFLTQLEVATGVKRTVFGKVPDHQAAVALTKANSALEDGDYVTAVTESLNVLRVEPENAAAWENLGTAYFALKQFEDSLKAWNRAYQLEKSPAIRAAIKGYIKSISRAKEKHPAPSRALAPALPARPSLSPQEAASLFNRAIDHYTRREFTSAKELLERIVAADPENVEAQKALRRVREELP